MNTATVFDISAGVVAKGQRAWTRIKATAEEQRVLWLEVGNALAVGRLKNQSDKLFGQWIKAYGFNDMGANTRASALWLSSNWELLNRDGRVEIPKEFTHPTNIRDWAREQEFTAALPADLQDIQPETVTVLNDSEGGRAAKTVLRSLSKGEGSDIAKKHLAALAKKHNTTVEELTNAAKAAAPEIFFQFGPAQVKAVEDLYSSQRNTVTAMEAYGFSREEIKNVFLKFASTI
jgi:hypothetical protein